MSELEFLLWDEMEMELCREFGLDKTIGGKLWCALVQARLDLKEEKRLARQDAERLEELSKERQSLDTANTRLINLVANMQAELDEKKGIFG